MLTELGADELYELGGKLRQRYMIENNLVRANYTRRDIYVRSTDFDR